VKDSIKMFVTVSLWIAIVLFVLRCIIAKHTELYDILRYASESIGVTVILMGLYERFAWKFNPFEKTPRISGSYSGIIEYVYNGKQENKNTNIKILQSLLSVNVKISTDEITSNTIASNIITENGDAVLYYTYITNPKSKYSRDNPIQYGTCRLIIDGKNELKGTYWTSRQTIGDLILKRII